MKFKHSSGEIDINKKLLASYSDEQLTEFGDANGIAPDDVVKLREKVGEAEVEEESQAPAKSATKKKK